ncbi:Hsp70 family protein [Rhodococcus coprophilus]|uniref:Hsp70 family protein n=1 Tax=Rhodococcus coprophilus TaxID=38310 RepID=UPI00340B4A9C
MPTSLGISVGASGVGSALRVDTPTGPATEYRRLAADSDRSRELGDLVFDAVSLRCAHLVERPVVTVAHRTDEQAESIRSAAERAGRHVRLVPETAAILAFLRTAGGVRSEAGTVAIADLGATGTTVSVLDQATGTVLRSARTEEVSGNALGARIYDRVLRSTSTMRSRRQIDPGLLAARCQGAQEVLTTAEVARIDIAEAGPEASVTLTREDLRVLSADLADTAAAFTRRICAGSAPQPQILALVGGAAGVPALADAIAAAFGGETVRVAEPASAAAQGAALIGDSPAARAYPTVGSSRHGRARSGGQLSGAVAGVLVLSAILAGFATEHFTARDTTDGAVSPLMTSGAVPSPDDDASPASSDTAIPAQDPDSLPISTLTSDQQVPSRPATGLLPPVIPEPQRSTTDSWTGSTTVTPTPIDQVPTPEVSPETFPDRDTTTAPPSTTTPNPSDLPGTDDTTPPVESSPQPVSPDPSTPPESEPAPVEVAPSPTSPAVPDGTPFESEAPAPPASGESGVAPALDTPDSSVPEGSADTTG